MPTFPIRDIEAVKRKLSKVAGERIRELKEDFANYRAENVSYDDGRKVVVHGQAALEQGLRDGSLTGSVFARAHRKD